MPCLVAIGYGLLVQFGLFGFGVDVYRAYYWAENWSFQTEPIGWYLSTLWIDNTWYVGAAITAVIISYGISVFTFLVLRNKVKIQYLPIVIVMILLTQPILFSATNILRQGIAMGFYFLALAAFYNKNQFKLIIFTALTFLSHNALIVLFPPLFVLSIKPLKRYRFYFLFAYSILIVLMLPVLAQQKSVISTSTSYFLIVLVVLCLMAVLFHGKNKHRVLIFLKTSDGLLLTYLMFMLVLLLCFFSYPSAMQRYFMCIAIPCILYFATLLPLNVSSRSKVLIFILTGLVYATLTSESYQRWSYSGDMLSL
jgi:hypothetical protein